MSKELVTAFTLSWVNYWFDVMDWQITMMEHASLLRRAMK
jgi:hypothetical protein